MFKSSTFQHSALLQNSLSLELHVNCNTSFKMSLLKGVSHKESTRWLKCTVSNKWCWGSDDSIRIWTRNL